MARFLADENIPKKVTSWLAEQGHDIVKAQDAALTGLTDLLLAKWAQDNDRMVVTLDDDFADLSRRLEQPPGVILVRTHPATPERIRVLVSKLLSKINIEKHNQALVVVSDLDIRIEP